jgi:protein-arginine kinase activator protein McsA
MTQTSHIKWTTPLFIDESTKIHNGKYSYSDTLYTKISQPVKIICPLHGSFWQKPIKHLQGQGCPECGKTKNRKTPLPQEEFECRARLIHGDKYEYSLYQGWSIPMEIICPEHGIFKQSPGSHILGRGCPECGKKTMGQRKWIASRFEERAKEIHLNKYIYDLSGFSSLQSYITIICPEHGAFRQMAKLHITKNNPQGCPKCGQVTSIDKRRTSTENIIQQAVKAHGNKYDYSRMEYKSMLEPVEIVCPTHGSFWQRMSDHLYNKCGCPSCQRFVSKGEDNVAAWIESLGFKVERNNRILLGGREIDIYIPEKRVAIEYNGLYIHSTAFNSDRLRHLDKLLLCQDAGIRLIQIWDIEWEKRQIACKDIIAFALGKVDHRIYARQCRIQKISIQESNAFLGINHIQGGCQAHYRIGLFFSNILVGVQCYTENTPKKWNLTRTSFMAGYHIIGGISKMFKFFESDNNPDEVIDYTDRRLFVASGHYQMGFSQECITPPTNSLTNGKELFSRRHYRHWGKRHFKFKMPWDDALTDTENLANNGWWWVWDCGKIKNVWKKSK